MKILLAISGLTLLPWDAGFAAQQAPAAQSTAPQPAPAEVPLNIQAQPMPQALDEFARQTGLQVVFATEEVARRLTAPRVSGTYAPKAALDLLLANSGLQYAFINAKTVAISAMRPKQTDAGDSPQERLRVATAGAADGEASGKDEVEEMLVEGERDKPAPFSTANLDLTRTEDDALPFTVFTARDIELSGAASLPEFFRNRLTQNFNMEIPEQMDGVLSVWERRVNQINFRNWGAAETVILLNGRRLPAEYQGGGTTDADNATPNLQGIPLGSIERIEILPSAGSAIYGNGATGGVINIITRQDYRGGQLFVNYETPSDVHRPQRGLGLSYGMPAKWGTNLRLTVSHNESEPLRVGDRADVSIGRWRRLALERDPSKLFDNGGAPFEEFAPPVLLGATPNIASNAYVEDEDAYFGVINPPLFGPGTATFATLRAGRAGTSLDDFLPATYNLDLAEGAAFSLAGLGTTFGPANTNTTFNLGADKRFNENWRWSVEYRYAEEDDEGQLGGGRQFNNPDTTSESPQVAAGAAINPFGQDVAVYLLDPRLQRPELKNSATNVTWGFNSTLYGAVGEWRGFLDLAYSHNRNRIALRQFWEPAGGWNQAFLDGRYNPFVDTRTVSPAAAGFYEDYIAYLDQGESAVRNHQAGLKASGPAWRLPAGRAQLTGGVDWSRSDRYSLSSFRQYQDGLTGGPRAPQCCDATVVDRTDTRNTSNFVFNTLSGYAEVNLPLVSRQQNLPLAERVEFFASARASRQVVNNFRSNGNEVEYTTSPYVYALGLRHEMLPGVSLRASRSIGFRPPALEEVRPSNPPQPGRFITFTDPVRMREVRLEYTQFINGGNPGLKPETTDSTDFGLILTPEWAPGLRFSVDYIENMRNDAISSVNPTELLRREAEFHDRIQRGPPDSNPSGVGPIIFMDYRMANFSWVSSKGVDFSLQQQLRNILGGRLSFAAAASRNISYQTQYTRSTPPVESIGIGSFIRWNANAQLWWEGRQWSVGWNARYFDRFLTNPDLASYYFLLQGGERIPSKIDHDVSVNYRAPALAQGRGLRMALAGTSISFGVKNVFDRAPRFLAESGENGFTPYDSIIGRSVWLQVRKDFQ